MSATIRLTVLTGPHKGNRYCLRGANTVLIGRSAECEVCLCGTERDKMISRRHCQVAVDAPMLRVRDLGSMNGTYINGRLVGAEENAINIKDDEPLGFARDGDIMTIGGTSVLVNMMDCPITCHDAGDGTPVWEENKNVKDDCSAAC
jgi:pSer/pThr/pTyr-binding forkhead associated (FHA) protein